MRTTNPRHGWISQAALPAALLCLLATLAAFPLTGAAAERSARAAFRGVASPAALTGTAPGYCFSGGGSTYFENISDVRLSKDASGVYTLVVDVFIANPDGCEYGQPCPTYDPSPEYVNAWIDWNADGAWSAGERVMDAALTGYGNINYFGTMTALTRFTAPSGAVAGPLWLRANLGWGDDPNDPCLNSWEFGNVFDRGVNLENPDILGITVVGVGTAGQKPETGSPVLLTAEIGMPDGYELTDCTWSGDLPPGPGNPSLGCRYQYVPSTGHGPATATYGPKRINLTIRYRHVDSGAVGRLSRNFAYKVYFRKGEPGSWGDDDGDGIPNWFEYWADDAAVPGLGGADVFYDQTLGANSYGYWSPADDNVHIGGAAAMTHYPSVISIPSSANCPGGTFGGAKGIDCAAEVVNHEKGHETIYHRWDAGGIWNGLADSDDPNHPIKHDWPGDDLPNSYETTRGTSTTLVDSCNLAAYKHPTYANYGDNELEVMRNSNGVTGTAANDWANPGKQTEPPFLSAPGLLAPGVSPAIPSSKSGRAGRFAPPRTDSPSFATALGSLTGAYSDMGIDNDGDGFYDLLSLSVGVQIDTPSLYNVVAWLSDGIGNPIAWANTQGQLNAGTQTVTVRFDGTLINTLMVDGPYHISRVELREGDEEILAAWGDHVHITDFYLYTSFAKAPARFSNSFGNIGRDTNGDGWFDLLIMQVGITVNKAGTFTLTGELEKGGMVVVGTLTQNLGEGTTIVELSFDGTQIYQGRQDGPYTLRRLRILDAGGRRVDFRETAATTQAFVYTSFQHGGAVIDHTSYSDDGLDTDGDGDFDYLTVGVTVQGIDDGQYLLSSELTDGAGGFIQRLERSVVLSGGDRPSLAFNFSGPAIFAHGIGGAFRVVRVTLQDADGGVVDFNQVGRVTKNYTLGQFDQTASVPVVLSGVYSDRGEDTSGNGLYESLVITVGFTPGSDGVAYASGRLVDATGGEIAWADAEKPVTSDTPTTIELRFPGIAIRANGKPGPYRLENLDVYLSGDPENKAHRDLAHTTGTEYLVTQFECPVHITLYRDLDGDGFGNPAAPVDGCEEVAGLVADHTDCDDTRANVKPSGHEVCDGLDNDCDGTVDDGVKITFYRDADGDGYGTPATTTVGCEAPAGYVPLDNDCDDGNPSINPGVAEICDAVDQDCDGTVDDGVQITFYRDADGDGYGDPGVTTQACSIPAGYRGNALDCDDSRADVNPGMAEVCDGRDNDCDGTTDEGVTLTFYQDLDGDGYGTNAATTQGCTAPAGFAPQTGDCNDGDPGINPGAAEVCDGIDQNCDLVADNGVLIPFYADSDGDGYGDSSYSVMACTVPDGFVVDNTDCNDGCVTCYPGAAELCDLQDNDCDGGLDEICKPKKPTLLKATALAKRKVKLTWKEDEPYETGYEIWRRTGAFGPKGWTKIKTVPLDVETYTDRTAKKAKQKYTYRIRGIRADVDPVLYSDYSKSVTVTTKP
jgi:hypothetical protein